MDVYTLGVDICATKAEKNKLAAKNNEMVVGRIKKGIDIIKVGACAKAGADDKF